MERISGIYLGSACFLAAVLYAAVFGDAGYLVKADLHKQVKILEENIEDLKQENQVLHEKYYQLKSVPVSRSQDPSVKSRTIIIKFTGIKPADFSVENASVPDREITLTEARSLYAVAALFVILSGFYIITVFARRRNGSEERLHQGFSDAGLLRRADGA